MKNSNDTIGNRTRNLPTCSAVPQPTALPRAPRNSNRRINKEESRWRSKRHYFGRRGRKKIVTLLEVFQALECYEKEDVRTIGIDSIRGGEWKFGLLANGGIYILKM